MTMFNDRLFIYAEAARVIYEVNNRDSSSPTYTAVGNALPGGVLWGSGVAAWSGRPANIADSIASSVITHESATVTVTATGADTDGQTSYIRYRVNGSSDAWAEADLSSTNTTAGLQSHWSRSSYRV